MTSVGEIRWGVMRVIVGVAIALFLAAYPVSFASMAHGATKASEVSDSVFSADGHAGHSADCLSTAGTEDGAGHPFAPPDDGCCADTCAPFVAVLAVTASCAKPRLSGHALPPEPAVLDGACLVPHRPPQ